MTPSTTLATDGARWAQRRVCARVPGEDGPELAQDAIAHYLLTTGVGEAALERLADNVAFRTAKGLMVNNPRAWFAKIARGRILDAWKRSQRRKTEVGALSDAADAAADEAPSIEELFHSEETRRIVAHAMTRLKQRDRELLNARYYEALNNDDARRARKAAGLDVPSRATFRQWLARAERRLRKALAEDLHDAQERDKLTIDHIEVLR